MTLNLLSKNPIKFLVSDPLAETAVILSPDDDEDTLVSKLQRVLELVGYVNTPQRYALPASVPVDPVFTPADRAAQEARLAGVKVNGWEEDASGDLADLPEV